MADLPILYSFRRCPYAIRARLAILASDFRCTIREVSLSNKPAEMLAVSPKATVPVMVLGDGKVLDESLDIMRYVLGLNDPLKWMGGVTFQALSLVETNDTAFKRHLDRYKYPDRYGEDPLLHRSEAMSILAQFDALLTRDPFLAASQRTYIDAAVFPFVRQFAAVDPVWFASQDIPHLRTWLEDFLNSDMFAKAMINLPVWKAGDQPILFP